MKPKRYQPSTPRAAVAAAAFAATAFALLLLVVVPASIEPSGAALPASAKFAHDSSRVTEVDISPARIDVVAERGAPAVKSIAHHARPSRKQPS